MRAAITTLGLVASLVTGAAACGPGSLHEEEIAQLRQLAQAHGAAVHRAPRLEEVLGQTARYVGACRGALKALGATSCHMMSAAQMTAQLASIHSLLEQHQHAMHGALDCGQAAALVDHHLDQMSRSLDGLQSVHGGHAGMHGW